MKFITIGIGKLVKCIEVENKASVGPQTGNIIVYWSNLGILGLLINSNPKILFITAHPIIPNKHSKCMSDLFYTMMEFNHYS